MVILFVSDVHLSNTTPNVTSGFLHFLKHYAIHAQALYILGDLFDVWVGDDICNILHLNIAIALQELHRKKIPCYFIHGNHDFLLSAQYASLCGMILLPEKQVLNLSSGKKIVILHGDTLCVNDHSYQWFRKFLNCQTIQELFLSLPLSIRAFIFNSVYYCCKKYRKYKPKNGISVNIKKVIDILRINQSEIMIHGHVHKPRIHSIHCIQNNMMIRIALGCWNKYASVIEINEKNNNITLIEFPLNKIIMK